MIRPYFQTNPLLVLFMILLTISLLSLFSLPDSFELYLAPNYMKHDEIRFTQISQEKIYVDFNQRKCDLKSHLTKNLSSDPYAVPPGQGYIIYTCRRLCGGFADRIQGMATAYSIAKQTGRLFRIEKTEKCDVTRYLRPSSWYNWTLDRNSLHNLSSCFHSSTRGGSRPWNDYIQYINESVIYIQTNERTKRLKQNFREIFYNLFVFEDSIVNEIQTFKSSFVKNNKTVCAHLRVGKSKNFTDVHYNNLGNMSAVWQFLSSYDKDGHVFYIASDSMEILASARKRFGERFGEIPGQIFNLAYDTDNRQCSGLRKNVLDFVMLSQCDILLLTTSNMGKRASELRNNIDDQYCFQYDKVYPCPHYNLKWLRSSENREPLIEI